MNDEMHKDYIRTHSMYYGVLRQYWPSLYHSSVVFFLFVETNFTEKLLKTHHTLSTHFVDTYIDSIAFLIFYYLI